MDFHVCIFISFLSTCVHLMNVATKWRLVELIHYCNITVHLLPPIIYIIYQTPAISSIPLFIHFFFYLFVIDSSKPLCFTFVYSAHLYGVYPVEGWGWVCGRKVECYLHLHICFLCADYVDSISRGWAMILSYERVNILHGMDRFGWGMDKKLVVLWKGSRIGWWVKNVHKIARDDDAKLK